jgi:uncharacterized membrane protein YidH (DUF202 family)
VVPFTALVYAMAVLAAFSGIYEIVDRGWFVENAQRRGRDRLLEFRRARTGFRTGAGGVVLAGLGLVVLSRFVEESSPYAQLIGGPVGASVLGIVVLGLCVVLLVFDCVLYARVKVAIRRGYEDPLPNGIPIWGRYLYFSVIGVLGIVALASAGIGAWTARGG